MAVIPLVAFVLAVVWSLVVLRGVLARIGPKPTYDDWMTADQIGGKWMPLIALGSALAALVGVFGFGAPGWVRATLLCLVFGFCAPFFLYGIFLMLFRRSPRPAPR